MCIERSKYALKLLAVKDNWQSYDWPAPQVYEHTVDTLAAVCFSARLPARRQSPHVHTQRNGLKNLYTRCYAVCFEDLTLSQSYQIRAALAGLLAVIAVPIGSAQVASSSLQSAKAILQLPQEVIRTAPQARLRGVVTESDWYRGFFLQDRSSGIWVFYEKPNSLRVGDDVIIEGTVGAGTYSPVVLAQKVTTLGRAPLPRPKPTTFIRLSNGAEDSQYVTVKGLVRSVGAHSARVHPSRSWLRLEMDGEPLDISLPIEQFEPAHKLIGAYVQIDGVASCTKNEDRQIIEPTLMTSGMEDIHVLTPPPSDLFSIPLTPVGSLMQYRSGNSIDRRAKVQGVATFYWPGESVIIEDRGQAIYIKTTQTDPLSIGDQIEVVGFPTLTATGPMLDDAVFHRLRAGLTVGSTTVQSEQLINGEYNNTLVNLQGKLMRELFEPTRTVLLIRDGSQVVQAELVDWNGKRSLPRIPEGTEIKVTGVCRLEVLGTWNVGPPNSTSLSYKLLLRDENDIEVLRAPSWWTTTRLIYLAIVLSLLLLALGALIIYTKIKHWRIHTIMEDRERLALELHDTLAQGFAGLGFQLRAIRNEIPVEMDHLRGQVDLAYELARHSHKEARKSVAPSPHLTLIEGDVLKTLLETGQAMTHGGGVTITAEYEGTPFRCTPEMADACVRIGQEAIANAIRHGTPTHIGIRLSLVQGELALSICDNGQGFVNSGSLLGFGLNGMRKRAAAVSGQLEIETQPGLGTTIRFSAPVPRRSRIQTVFGSYKSFFKRRRHVTE